LGPGTSAEGRGGGEAGRGGRGGLSKVGGEVSGHIRCRELFTPEVLR
jgi:hypothetical protein